MKFWEMSAPVCHFDEKWYVNGIVSYPYRIPRIQCPACKVPRGMRAVLPHAMPRALRSHNLLGGNRAAPPDVVVEFLTEIECALADKGVAPGSLQPGINLLPSKLEIPSTPNADFLWPEFESIFTSQRMTKLLKRRCAKDAVFTKAKLGRVGDADPDDGVPRFDPRHREAIFDRIPLLEDASDVGPYHQVIVTAESGPHPARKLRPRCPICRVEKARNSGTDIEVIMTEDMWKGNGIFFLQSTSVVIVTDSLKQEIEDLGATNVEFKEVPAVSTKRSIAARTAATAEKKPSTRKRAGTKTAKVKRAAKKRTTKPTKRSK